MVRGHQHPQPVQTNPASLALLSTSAGAWAFSDGRYFSVNMTAQGEIMAYILTNPGVYLREISEDLGLSLGAVQYHIWALTRRGQLEECRSGRYRRFFGAARYEEAERIILSLLRQGTDGKILTALSEGSLTHAELSVSVGVSSQALTWHIKRLTAIGVVEAVPLNGNHRWSYRLPGQTLQGVLSLIRGAPRPMLGRSSQ